MNTWHPAHLHTSSMTEKHRQKNETKTVDRTEIEEIPSQILIYILRFVCSQHKMVSPNRYSIPSY